MKKKLSSKLFNVIWREKIKMIFDYGDYRGVPQEKIKTVVKLANRKIQMVIIDRQAKK